MSVTKEEVDVHYCDICNKRESRMDRIDQCRRCRRDVCSQHFHYVSVEYLNTEPPRWFSHLCDSCRDEMTELVAPILDQFKPALPEAAESRSEPT